MKTAPRLVGFAGKQGAGKSTAAASLVGKGYVVAAFAGILKLMVSTLWDIPFAALVSADKDKVDGRYAVPPRHFAQAAGAALRRIDADVFVRYAMKQADAWLADYPGTALAFDDVRYANEAAAIRERGGVVIRILRPGFDGDGHESETQEFKADFEVVNDGTVEELVSAVAAVLELK